MLTLLQHGHPASGDSSPSARSRDRSGLSRVRPSLSCGTPSLANRMFVCDSGGVVAYNSINKRSRGVGFAMLYTAMLVALYYVPMLAWVLRYFQL
jgi:hypothetical protein